MPDRTAPPAPSRASLPSFDLGAEQVATLEAASEYGRRELYPLAARMDAEEWWPAAAFAKLGTDGYLGVTVPERYGGVGADLFTSGLVLQAFSRWNHALGLSWVAHDNLCANNIYRNAGEELRRRYLPGLCAGKLSRRPSARPSRSGLDALDRCALTARRRREGTTR
jgi:isovaleryl-CoA dehydrogenase